MKIELFVSKPFFGRKEVIVMTVGASVRRALCLVLGLFIISLSGPFAEGAVLYVTQKGAGNRDGSSWSNACGEARFPVVLSEARSGTELWIARGRYRPDTQGRQDQSFVLPPGVALYGGFSGFENTVEQRDPEINVTVLTGDLGLDDAVNSHGVTEKVEDIAGLNSHTVVKCEGDPTAAVLPERYDTLVDGLVISAGKRESDSSPGGLEIKNVGVIVNRCSFFGNAGRNGGGIRSESSRIRINECTFYGNTGFSGGGVSCSNTTSRIAGCDFTSNFSSTDGGAINNGMGDMIVDDCYFGSNTCELGGGGISNAGGKISVKKCMFSGNQSEGPGGAILHDTNQAEIEACTFFGNSASFNHGGGIMNGYGDLFVKNSVFYGNQTKGSWGRGGGIANWNLGYALAENCTFYGNSSNSGGGVANWNTISLMNCTFYKNSAEMGNDVFAVRGEILGTEDRTEAVNCIFWNGNSGNTLYAETPAALVITHSIVRGGWPGIGNIDSDPLLGTPAYNGGPTMTCALLPGSPAIDSGTSAGAPEKDQRGIDRPQKSGFDRGAYEVSVRKFLVMRAPFPGAFRFSSATEQFESGEGTAWGFPEGIPVTVTFLPQAGKRLKDVLVDRRSVGAVSSYTFPNLDRDHEIEAVFLETPSSSGGGGCSAGSGFFSFLLLIPLLLIGRRR